MPILDVFKKEKREKKPKEEEKAEKPLEVAVEKKVKEKRETKIKKISKIAYRVLKAPHITEKTTQLFQQNQYVFKVYPKANKTEIKKAIEDLYGVDVVSVRIIKIPKKRRVLGRTRGFRKGYKKAIIKIKEGQKIEVSPR